MTMRFFGLAIVFAALLAPATTFAQGIGEAVGVTPGARLTTNGQSVDLSPGKRVAVGDIVETDGSGQVQLIFADDTKVAVGPNSRLVVDDVLMQSSGKAKRFAVSAVAGSFRFISGGSAKSAYSVRTPTATLGIRGTLFDVSVDSARGTDLVLLSGEVRMCGQDGACADVTGFCAAATASPAGELAAPRSREEKARIIQEGFPFIRTQASLRRDFRTALGSCGQAAAIRNNELRPVSPAVAPAPPVEPKSEPRPPISEPEPEPAPEPSQPTGGFPGQSGDSGPSQGKGNAVSQGQSGTGTGKGKGAEKGKKNGP